MLNWTPGADHAPLYYALTEGWYAEAGIDLSIETGRGSAMSAQSVGVGASPIGIAELGTAFVARSQGANLVAVMSLYANAPFVFYWKKSTGIEDVADFEGRTIGNPPADAARIMLAGLCAGCRPGCRCRGVRQHLAAGQGPDHGGRPGRHHFRLLQWA